MLGEKQKHINVQRRECHTSNINKAKNKLFTFQKA